MIDRRRRKHGIGKENKKIRLKRGEQANRKKENEEVVKGVKKTRK